MPIKVISTIKPVNAGQFPVVEDTDMHGGYQVRTNTTDRNSIPISARKEGMLVFVQSDDKFYTLTGGVSNADWVEKQFGGGALAGDVTGPTGSNTVVKVNGVGVQPGAGHTDGSSLVLINTINSSVYLHPQGMATDGAFVWNGNYQFKSIDKTNLTTGLATSIDLTSFLPGGATSWVRKLHIDPNATTHLFLATMDASRILIMDTTNNTIIGIGDAGGDRIRSMVLDNNGNVWGGNHNGTQMISRFVIADMLASFPTPVSPASTVSVAGDAEEMAYDGTDIWVVTTNGDIDRVDPTGNGTNLGTINPNGDWYASVVAMSGQIFVLKQNTPTMLRFDPNTFPSAPAENLPLTNFTYAVTMTGANGFLWVPDNTSGSGGPDNDNILKISINPLTQVDTIPRPNTEKEWFEAVADPNLNQIYVAVYSDDAGITHQGFRTLNTSSDIFTASYSQLQAPVLTYIPASGTVRPTPIFVGQMFFDTTRDTPQGGQAIWWNGTLWIDASGDAV